MCTHACIQSSTQPSYVGSGSGSGSTKIVLKFLRNSETNDGQKISSPTSAQGVRAISWNAMVDEPMQIVLKFLRNSETSDGHKMSSSTSAHWVRAISWSAIVQARPFTKPGLPRHAFRVRTAVCHARTFVLALAPAQATPAPAVPTSILASVPYR